MNKSKFRLDFGQRIRCIRKKKGISQLELAKKLGYVSRSSITHIEDGRDCPFDKIEILADALGTTPMYLFGYESEKTTLEYALLEKIKKLSLTQTTKVIAFIDELISE